MMLVREGTKNKKIFLAFGQRVFVFCSLFFCLLILATPALAQTPGINTGIDQFGQYTALAQTDIRIIIAKIIRVALGLVGIVLVGFTIYAGYMYMTAGGNEEQINTAKKILKNLAVGLGIVLSAFAITQFVINMLTGQTGGGGTAEGPGEYGEEFRIGGALGQTLESHYPMRNAIGIPRNTKIVVTFREKFLPQSLVKDTNSDGIFGNLIGGVADQINDTNIKIYKNEDGVAGAISAVDVFVSADGRTIVMKPASWLGDARQDTKYTARLTGGVSLADGRPAFPNSYYSWEFIVSPVVDLTPPKVESVIPLPTVATAKYPRNILVQINFNEPVDPISASGLYSATTPGRDFQNITTVTSSLVGGEYRLTNQYRTVEFKTNDECGKDPCGQSIFCLPASAAVLVTARAATVDSSNPPQAAITANIYDGVVDMAGNSLDGGGELRLDQGVLKHQPGPNGQAEGPATDNFYWAFNTSAVLHTTAPRLTGIAPNFNEPNVAPNAPLTLSFDELMSAGSLNELRLKTDKEFNVWYTARATNYDAAGAVVTAVTQIPVRTTAELWHGDFWRSSSPNDPLGALYFPFAPSLLSDIYQICYYQAIGPGCASLADTSPSCANGASYPGASMCASATDCPYNSYSIKP